MCRDICLCLSLPVFLSYPWPNPACSVPIGTLLFLGLRRLTLYFFRPKSWLLNLGWLCHMSSLLWGARVREPLSLVTIKNLSWWCPWVTSEWQGYIGPVESCPPPAKVREEFSPYITWQEFSLLAFWTDWSVTHGTEKLWPTADSWCGSWPKCISCFILCWAILKAPKQGLCGRF